MKLKLILKYTFAIIITFIIMFNTRFIFDNVIPNSLQAYRLSKFGLWNAIFILVEMLVTFFFGFVVSVLTFPDHDISDNTEYVIYGVIAIIAALLAFDII